MGFLFAVPASSHPDSVIWGPSEVLLCSTPLLLPSPGITVTRLQRTAQDTGILSLLGDCFNRTKPFPFQVLNAEIKADKSSAGQGDIKSWISRSALSSAALVRLSWAKPTWHTQNWQTQGTNLCKYPAEHTVCTRKREDSPILDGRIFRVCYTSQTCSYLHNIQSKSFLKMDKYFLNHF